MIKKFMKMNKWKVACPLTWLSTYFYEFLCADEQTTEIGILPANFCISHHADWTNAVKSYIKEIGITGGEMDDM